MRVTGGTASFCCCANEPRFKTSRHDLLAVFANVVHCDLSGKKGKYRFVDNKGV